jgi:hypothetical protein
LGAGGTEPEVFGFKRDSAEFGLVDHSAHKEFSHTVPGADRIAFATLIAEFVSFPTCLFDAINHYFERGEG